MLFFFFVLTFVIQRSMARYNQWNTPVWTLTRLSSTATCTRTTPSISRYAASAHLPAPSIMFIHLNIILQPKTFENWLQGPKDNKSKPIPYMNSKGQEFPLFKSPAGYKGEAPGTVRVVAQPTKTGKPSLWYLQINCKFNSHSFFQVKSSKEWLPITLRYLQAILDIKITSLSQNWKTRVWFCHGPIIKVFQVVFRLHWGL